MQQQQQRMPTAEKTSLSLVAAYEKLIAPYRDNPQHRLTKAERDELVQQLSDLLPPGRYQDVGGYHLVHLIKVDSFEGGRAIDCFVKYKELSGVEQALPVAFFLEMHHFRYIDGAS